MIDHGVAHLHGASIRGREHRGGRHHLGRRANAEQRRRLDEVTAVVGQPAQLRGTDQTVLVYELEPGVVIHVQASPSLVAVQQLMDGATLDLV